jgi:hypothetical protein
MEDKEEKGGRKERAQKRNMQKSQAQNSKLRTSSASSDIPDKANHRVCHSSCLPINLVLIETTPDLVKHARPCIFLRYKEDDPSGCLSIFFSSFQLEAPWAWCSLLIQFST